VSLRLVRTALPALALACAFARPEAARAQVTGSITAIADVNNTALSVATLAELTFGTVVPGSPITVDPSTSTVAGKFELHGARNAQFNATFTLPTVLQAGAGGPTMPVTFGSGAGCHYNRDQQNRCVAFDPSTPLVQRLRNNPPPNDSYFVWIGGTVSPGPTQSAGVYQGTITITAVYTGL
jgi:hypothetical protein